ncbi:hypothetical protein VP01_1183g1 [Puccinia sorghi]|uniref:Uncharacterized protein n=1 Tax=Puccinia sorghi TaxID=27349 RepID=A0A0L6VSF9_9BASI|nr:hypothetical protein VP01_1183g1 [Puccinia sorghi]
MGKSDLPTLRLRLWEGRIRSRRGSNYRGQLGWMSTRKVIDMGQQDADRSEGGKWMEWVCLRQERDGQVTNRQGRSNKAFHQSEAGLNRRILGRERQRGIRGRAGWEETSERGTTGRCWNKAIKFVGKGVGWYVLPDQTKLEREPESREEDNKGQEPKSPLNVSVTVYEIICKYVFALVMGAPLQLHGGHESYLRLQNAFVFFFLCTYSTRTRIWDVCKRCDYTRLISEGRPEGEEATSPRKSRTRFRWYRNKPEDMDGCRLMAMTCLTKPLVRICSSGISRSNIPTYIHLLSSLILFLSVPSARRPLLPEGLQSQLKQFKISLQFLLVFFISSLHIDPKNLMEGISLRCSCSWDSLVVNLTCHHLGSHVKLSHFPNHINNYHQGCFHGTCIQYIASWVELRMKLVVTFRYSFHLLKNILHNIFSSNNQNENVVIHAQGCTFFLEMIITHISYSHHVMTLIFFLFIL